MEYVSSLECDKPLCPNSWHGKSCGFCLGGMIWRHLASKVQLKIMKMHLRASIICSYDSIIERATKQVQTRFPWACLYEWFSMKVLRIIFAHHRLNLHIYCSCFHLHEDAMCALSCRYIDTDMEPFWNLYRRDRSIERCCKFVWSHQTWVMVLFDSFKCSSLPGEMIDPIWQVYFQIWRETTN